MRLSRGHCGKLESIIAVFILFLLIATAAGVYWVQRDFNMVRFGIVSEQEQQGDFLIVGKAETYNTDNLYEKIDGKAPMYQDAGFVKLTTQRFSDAKNEDLGFELYQFDMGNAKNAFCVYSRQKRADVVDLNDFQFGYQTTNGIYFAYGKYYVEMVGFAESQELINAMKTVAEKLIAEMPADGKDVLNDLSIFPPGTVPGSWQLQLRDAFGYDGLTDTYSAKYGVDGKAVTIFFSRRNNTNDADKTAKNYTDFLVTNGAKVIEPNILDFYGNTEIVFRAGHFVAGVHEADDRQAAIKAAGALSEHLKKISEKN